jgi:RNA polymerase sigma-70 factor (ECF subfamily)
LRAAGDDDQADREDARRVLAGDTDAFAGIVHRWQGPLVTLAFRLCRDRHRAEDLAQLAFVKVFRSLRQWRGDAAFANWLFAVAYSVYRSELRRRWFAFRPIGDAPEDRAAAELDVQGLDRAALVRDGVARLPPKYRDVMVLFYFHEMDVAQTAETMLVAEGTVKARLHRARALLRKLLSAELDPGEREA